MADPQLVLCGGLPAPKLPPAWRAAAPLALDTGNGCLDVHLRLDRLTGQLHVGVPDVEADLLDVAAFVFTADQCVSRGGTRAVDYGDAWRRRFRFEVPVRRPDVWGRADLRAALTGALAFLTDDAYEFHFHPAPGARGVPPPTLFDALPVRGDEFSEVALFSGGLDSLCGAADAVLGRGDRVALVSLRSSTRVAARQDALFGAVRARVGDSAATPLHVGVTLNKGEDLTREYTQRSRSFAFAAAAAVVARRVGLAGVRFYENGVTSLNLPVSPELVGARASRTTHPRALAAFARLFSLLFDTPFAVTNPFQWATKAELLARLKAAGHADLCPLTCRRGHVWGVPEGRPHCGSCSQCVDRRLSALAGGLTDAEDPPARYASDPLTAARDGEALTFAERYGGAAWEAERIATPAAFAERYPEVLAAAPHTGLPADEALAAAHALLRRHGAGGDARGGRGDRGE